MKKSIVSLIMVCVFMMALVMPSFSVKVGGNISVSENFTDTERWEGDGTLFTKRRVNAQSGVIISRKDELPISVTYDTLENDISKITEINISFILKSNTENVLTVTGYREALPWEDAEKVFENKVSFNGNESLTLHIPVHSDNLDKIHFETSATVTHFAISDISMDNGYSYVYLEAFESHSVEVNCNSANVEDKALVLYSETGLISFSPMYLDGHGEDAVYLVNLTVKSSADGKISVSTDSENSASSEQSMNAGQNTYYFFIFGAFNNISFNMASDVKSFSAVLSKSSIVKVGSLYENDYGKISSCTLSESGMVISGVLQGDAINKFIGSDFYVFASNPGETPELSKDKAVATSEYSTRFEIEVPEFEYFKSKVYYVYMDTFMGLQPVGLPCVIGNEFDVFSGGKTDSAVKMAYDANLTHFIYSGAESALFSIKVSDAMVDDGSYTDHTHEFNSQTYGFKPEFCEMLESNIETLKAFGKNSYFEIIPDSDNFEKVLCLTDWIKGKAKGVVIGDLSHFADDDETLASLYAIAVGLIKSENPDVYTAIELCGENRVTRAMSLRYYLSVLGIKATGFSVNDVNYVDIQNRLNTSLVSAGFETAPLCATVNTFVSDYGEALTATDALNYVFCSAVTDNVLSVCDKLPQIKAGEICETAPKYSKVLVDYTNSYDTSGWMVCGGFRTPTTEHGSDGKRFALIQSSENPSIAMYSFASPVNAKDCKLGISFAAEGSGDTELSIVLGGDSQTVRYTVNAENGTLSDCILDLSDFSDKSVKYISIEKVGSESLRLYVNDIKLYSDNEELLQSQTVEKGAANYKIYLAAVIAVLTVILFFFILFNKKTNER